MLVSVALAVAVASYLGVGLRGQSGVQPRALAGNAAVTGVVVDGATRQVVSMAEVVLASPETQYKTWTDGSGRFVFNGVAASRFYQLTATKVGYLRGSHGTVSPDPHLAGFAPIHLAGDEWVRDLEVTIWKPASISGTVRDELGRPMVGVFVRVQTAAVVAGARHLAGGNVVRSDDRGVYRVFGLTQGTYVVVALPKDIAAPPAGGQPTVYRATYHPSVSNGADAATIRLAHAESREGADVIVPAVAARSVRGRVVGPLDRFDHFTVRLSPRGDPSVGVGGAAALAPVAPDGSFRFDSVPEGDYQVDVAERWPELSPRPVDGAPILPGPLPLSMGGGPKRGWILPLPSGPFWSYYPESSTAGNYWAHATLGVGSGESDDLVLQLEPRLSVSGRVEIEGNARATPGIGRRFVAADPFGTTANVDAETGVFVLGGLTPGRYHLRIPMESTYVIRSISWMGQEYRNQALDVASDVAGVVVTLTDQVVSFSGTVRDDAGRPATSAAVLVFPTDPAHRMMGGDATLGFTDATGRYAVGTEFTPSSSRLPAGDYLLVAVPPALADRSYDLAFLERAARVATRVTADWGESPVVNLTVQNVRVP